VENREGNSVTLRRYFTPLKRGVNDMSTDSQPLSSLAAGSGGTVTEIKVPPEHRGRLLEMGLLVGTPIQLVRFAPLGDPVEIKVRGYHLTLRKHEAEQIWVRPT
jgi:ferrous iron transport protein A